jgi:hypothetical protein
MSDPIPTVRNPLRYRCQFGIGSRSGAYAPHVFSFVRRGRKVRSQVATPNCAPQAATVDQQFTCEHAWLVIKKNLVPRINVSNF